MATHWRKLVVIASVATLGACSHARQNLDKASPPPGGSASPSAPHERKEADPPLSDPSKKPPAGYKRMAIGGIAPSEQGNAVVLTDEQSKTGLLIFVGGTEALSIALRLEHKKYERPLTHDLLDDVVHELGGSIVSVRVDRLEDNVYYGSVLILRDGHLFTIDARPSDALALAVGNSAPVFVADAVLQQAGIDIRNYDLHRFVDEAADCAPGRGEVEL